MIGDPWQDRNGNSHQSLRVTANAVKILSGGNYNGNNNNNNNSQPAEEEEAPF